MRRALTRLAMLLFAASSIHCAAQDNGPYKLSVNAQLVLIDASITDRKSGAVVFGLQPGDLLLTEDAVAQPIAYLSQDKLPLSIALLFDLTDTVHPVVDQLAAGARAVLDHLGPDDEVSILTFSDHTELIQKYTSDHSRLIASLSEAAAAYDPDTPTYLHEDLFTAIDLTAHPHDEQSRKVQIWLTDGTANEQNPALFHRAPGYTAITPHTRDEATDHLLRSGEVVSLLIARSRLTAQESTHNPGAFVDFERYAALTGGPVVEASTKDAASQLGDMITALRHRYTIGYRPSTQKPAGTVCHITLKLAPAFFLAHPFLHEKDIVIRTRQEYIR